MELTYTIQFHYIIYIRSMIIKLIFFEKIFRLFLVKSKILKGQYTIINSKNTWVWIFLVSWNWDSLYSFDNQEYSMMSRTVSSTAFCASRLNQPMTPHCQWVWCHLACLHWTPCFAPDLHSYLQWIMYKRLSGLFNLDRCGKGDLGGISLRSELSKPVTVISDFS